MAMVYPYDLLNNFYHQKREQFFDADRKYAKNSPTWNSCSMLYIDALIDRECGGVGLYRDWRDDGGSGLYPPRSLQSMLRVLLLPNVSIQSKYSIFMYLFMDLNVVYQDHECHALIQNLCKFPTAFKMPKDMIKLIESFWHLDHNNFDEAIVDLKASSMAKWQLELMVECLFLHQWPQLSLRALQMPGPSISPVIEMRVLLGNNLISEAFLFQKKHGDKSLLLEFFNSCFKLGSLRSILKLPLTESEGQLLGEFLLSVDASMPRNLHFVYLLQRSKYVEAVELVESLQLKKGQLQQPPLALDSGSVSAVLSTYKATMPPIYQEMSEVYRKTGPGRGAPRSSMTPSMCQMEQSGRTPIATPLSSQLIRNKMDVNSSVYQMAITAVKEATNYSLFQGNQSQQNQSFRSPNKFTSIPFLRKPLQETMYEHETSAVVYPTIVEGNADSKRKTVNDVERDEHLTKRRKLDDINTGLLTSFEPSKVDRLLEFSQRKAIPVPCTLSTPIVKRVQNAETSSSGKMTPHSILKARNIFRDSPGPEEKILRFKHGASVSPSLFDVSAIKKPQEAQEGSSGAGKYGEPKARRSIRSVTPEDHILSSTRNQIDADETRPVVHNNNKMTNLEEEIKSKITAVAEEEKQLARTKVATSTSQTYLPKRELRSQEEDQSSGEERKSESSGAEDLAQKLPPIMPRRSLRSRTPEQVSPRSTTTTRSATKKTLTRMVLESNAKRNLMEQRPDDVPEAMEETINTSLDSTLPMSDYSLNLCRDPLAANKTILADDSCVSDSILGEWKERLQGQRDTTRDSFVSDTSGVPTVGDVLLESPNQSLQFVAPEEISVNKSIEEELKEKLNEVDQLKEDTVYLRQPNENQEVKETIEKEEEEEDKVPPKADEEQFKVPTPPKSHKDATRLPFLVNQDTFIVQSQESQEEDVNKEEINILSELEGSPEDEYDDDEEDEESDDLSNVSIRSDASNDDDDKVEHDFPGEEEEVSEESLNYGDDLNDYSDSDPSDNYSDEDESAAPKEKPFKTNEVIDLLDSDDEDEAGKEKAAGSSEDSLESDSKTDQRVLADDKDPSGDEQVEEYVPSSTFGNLQYGATFDIDSPAAVAEEEVVAEPKEQNNFLESPQMEKMDDEPIVEPTMEGIYDDMEVDVVGDEEGNGNGGLNDALMVEESSNDVDMCLRIDEDSQPPSMVVPEQTIVEGESTVHALDRAVLLEDTLAIGSDTVTVEPEAVVESVEEDQKEEEKETREEVSEVIPPPKIAYQTTEEKEVVQEIVPEITEIPVIIPEVKAIELKSQNVEEETVAEPEIPSVDVPEKTEDVTPTVIPEATTLEQLAPQEIVEKIPEESKEVAAVAEVPTTPEIQKNPPLNEEASTETTPVLQSQLSTQSTDSATTGNQPAAGSSQQTDDYPAGSESSQPERLTVRRRSVRAVSQPRNSLGGDELLAGRIKTRRATAEAVEGGAAAGTPRRRNSHLFDSEERVTPNLRMTPMRLARKTESIENLAASGTPTTRRTRATSIESDVSGVRTPTTRSTRGRSKQPAEHEEEDDNISVASNTSRRSLRSRRAATDNDADDAKSTVSSSSVASKKGSKAAARAKTTLMDTTIPEETEIQDYSMSRRLTRNQQQMMERSLKVQNRALDASFSSISPGTPPVDLESAESDADSLSSKVSRASQKRRSVRAMSKEVIDCDGDCPCARKRNRRRDSLEEEGGRGRGGPATAAQNQVNEFEIIVRFRVTSASPVQVHAVPEAHE